MILSERMLERLADDARLPASSRRAFRRTLQLQAALGLETPRRPALAASVSTFDCEQMEELPGVEVETATSTDPTALRAFRYTDGALRFLKHVFGRDSIDGAGAGLVSSIHYSRAYANAFWTREQMVYGDGDGLVLLDFTLAPEFVGHEIFHGVTQYACDLEYSDEPGALNESISDAFGSMFAQWIAGEDVTQAHWRIGPALAGPTALSLGWKCVRDLADPSSPESMARQPASYDDYIPGGDPHDNSGIPNRAFHTVALALGGFSWERAGKVWFESLVDPKAHKDMGFAEFAALTLANARRLFPSDPAVSVAVAAGWREVGVSPACGP